LVGPSDSFIAGRRTTLTVSGDSGFYHAWIEWCRAAADVLKEETGFVWRARDVEMAAFQNGLADLTGCRSSVGDYESNAAPPGRASAERRRYGTAEELKVICARCGHNNPDIHKHCVECGEILGVSADALFLSKQAENAEWYGGT
jgi:hypothetical protein